MLYQSVYYTRKNIKSSYNNNKFKISAPTWKSHLEITEVALIHCNIVNDDYQQDARVLYTFVPNKHFGSLLEISPKNHIFLKTFNSEYDKIKVWFTDQNSQPLEMEDQFNNGDYIKIIK